ncbi:hypothetical protein [Enterococcus asini]|uniref:hypothetical protein n=1 Tax=Enterococcus asini TaxID=57732 RepID=UPI00266D97E5|nr:hypothetical protein [Enterococcus asini]
MKRGIRLISWLAVFLVMMQGVVPVLGVTDEKLQEESSEIFSKADSSTEKKKMKLVALSQTKLWKVAQVRISSPPQLVMDCKLVANQ